MRVCNWTWAGLAWLVLVNPAHGWQSPVDSLAEGFSASRLEKLRNDTRAMFYHGWNSYMDFAFPDDEIRPISCRPLAADTDDPTNINLNDVLGGYSVTLIDSLDMFAIMNDHANFVKNVKLVERYVTFDVPSTVQVFETTIRGMGGLLSAHLYASVPRLNQTIDGYDGHLLALAYDLGLRLLPAFDTDSGIPHPRVNLQRGVVPIGDSYITETCTSGAGSLVLEFTLLSRLTGDPRFEQAARRAFEQLWSRKSSIDMLGITIDAVSGQWQSVISGIGAGVDSFYEYAVKFYVLFGDQRYYAVFERLYDALTRHSSDGWIFRNVNFTNGTPLTSWIDALAAFFPGLQVLAGDVAGAIKNHLAYFKLWNTYGGIPERWSPDMADSMEAVVLEWYPLRPEFIESNYYIYRATKDPFYLQVGESTMKDFERNNRVTCGFAGMQDVRSGELADRMDSFFLSETAKYLYLLFDDANLLNQEMSNFVFSTEAHPLWYDEDVIEHASVERYAKVAKNVRASLGPAVIEEEDEDYDTLPIARLLYDRTRGRWTKKRPEANNPETNSDAQSYSQPAGDPTCRIPPQHRSDFSVIASWSGFYDLDRGHNYTKPDWLAAHTDRPQWMQLDKEFYWRYTRNDATCPRYPETQSIALDFHSSGASASELAVGVSWYEHPDGSHVKIYRTGSLSGRRIRFQRTVNDFQGRSGLRITSIGEIAVGAGMVVVDQLLLAADPNAILHVVDGIRVTVFGEPIVNMLVNVGQSGEPNEGASNGAPSAAPEASEAEDDYEMAIE